MTSSGTAGGDSGQALHALVSELYPICRSITGHGVRETLRRLQAHVDLEIVEVPSGTRVLDWTVPREWNIRDAYIKDARGERIVDFRQSNLHVMSYSRPVHETMSLAALRPHLFSSPEHPTWIPYRTSYYAENWGFCLRHDQLESLEDGDYEVCIDASLTDGSLSYGELHLPGDLDEEVLISCHVCHPSLCNDNLSGVSVATHLARELARARRRYSYRVLFIPGTIGAIAWLAANGAHAGRVRHGLVLTGVGDPGPFHYKRSRRGNAAIDAAAVHVLRHSGVPHEVLDFVPYGYDERQYCSPGFDLPVGCLMRSVWGQYPEYHFSADDTGFVTPESLAGSLRLCLAIVDVLERNERFWSTSPYGEPQLGRRGLYQSSGDGLSPETLARLWVLNLSDGRHTLLDIAERAGMAFPAVRAAADELAAHGLLSRDAPVPSGAG